MTLQSLQRTNQRSALTTARRWCLAPFNGSHVVGQPWWHSPCWPSAMAMTTALRQRLDCSTWSSSALDFTFSITACGCSTTSPQNLFQTWAEGLVMVVCCWWKVSGDVLLGCASTGTRAGHPHAQHRRTSAPFWSKDICSWPCSWNGCGQGHRLPRPLASSVIFILSLSSSSWWAPGC